VGPIAATSTPAANLRQVSVADARSTTGAVTRADLVPVGATAIAYNVTVTGTQGGGWVRVTPGDMNTDGTSTINWTRSGTTIANGSVVGLDSERNVNVTAGGSGSTHVVIDIVGYYLPENARPDGQVFTAMAPARAYDSRTSASGNGALQSGTSQIVDLDAKVALPAGTAAVAYNITLVNADRPGNVAVVPADAASSGVSSINISRVPDVIANGLTVGVADGAKIKVASGGPTTDYIIDVVGYFTSATTTPTGARFYSIAPGRAYDSRAAAPAPGHFSPDETRIVSVLDGRDQNGAVTTAGIVPADAKAVVFNATTTSSTGRGFLSVTPGNTADSAAFTTSTLNWMYADTTRANASVVAVSAGQVKLGVSSSEVNVVLDVTGYYR
jgi:hypothetical protein